MELREIVNLRKLNEYFDNVLPEEQCYVCPLRCVCPGNVQELGCLAKKMLNEVDDMRDLYDIEADETAACKKEH